MEALAQAVQEELETYGAIKSFRFKAHKDANGIVLTGESASFYVKALAQERAKVVIKKLGRNDCVVNHISVDK